MELLVVLTLVMALLSLGVGIFMRLRRTYAFPAQVSLVRTIIRKARNFALTRGVGATVIIDPWRNEARACGIRTSGYWSFDTEASDGTGTVAPGAYGYDGKAFGVTWINGAFGGAYDFQPDQAAYIECQDPGAGIFDDVTGIHFSMWIRPADLKALMAAEDDENGGPVPEVDLAGFVLIAKMPVYCLRLMEDYSLEFVAGDVSIRGWVRTRPGVVFPNRWNKIEVTYDGLIENELDRIRIVANGIECFELYAFDRGEKIYFRSPEGYTELEPDELRIILTDRIPRTEEPLTISCRTSGGAVGSGMNGFVGAIDEVSVSVVVSDEVVRLTGARLKGYRREIRFDKRGRLDAAYHCEPVVVEITNDEFYRAPKPFFLDEEGEGEGSDDEDEMGIGPKIPSPANSGRASGASASTDAAQGLVGNNVSPKTSSLPGSRKSREGARTVRIVVELSGNLSSRPTVVQGP